jgi:SsrA-binding protein
MKLLAKNRRATFDYEIGERLVAGLELSGSEVKSIKNGHASLKGSFVIIREGEAWLNNAHVTPYQASGQLAKLDPTRVRKLLLHRKELGRLMVAKREGYAIVPTALLLDKRFVKLEIGIGRGKKRFDKRQSIKERDTSRDVARNLTR